MLSTAKSANIGFSQVVQLFAPSANPANAPRAEKNSFYKFRKKNFGVSTMCAKILGFSRVLLRLGFRLEFRVRVGVSIRVSLV